jgi:hypothetical protein
MYSSVFAQTTDDVINRVNKCVGKAIANFDLINHLLTNTTNKFYDFWVTGVLFLHTPGLL